MAGPRSMMKCIRMGMTVMKIFIWGGISSVLLQQISFYSDASGRKFSFMAKLSGCHKMKLKMVKPIIYLPK